MFAAWLNTTAHAASFECAAATQPIEQLICSDPDLSRLDDELGRAYKAYLSNFSEAARIKITQRQRSWLKAVRTVCGDWLKRGDKPAARECLKQEYSDRLPGLPETVNSDPYRFFYAGLEEAVRMPADLASAAKTFVRHRMVYPQIDAPESPDAARWNERIASLVKGEFLDPGLEAELDTVDLDVGFAIVEALPGFISGRSYVNYQTVGWAHPGSFAYAVDFLMATGESVQPGDLFNDALPWRDALARISAEKMADDARYPFEASAIVDQVDSNWDISTDHLTVHVDFYQMKGGWRGGGTAEIPWRELKPYLRSDLPIPLKLD